MKVESEKLLATVHRFRNETVESTGVSSENPKTTATPATDRVDLSRSKEKIDKLKGVLTQTQENPSEKIAALKQQIADGTYQVDSKEVAGKMIERWREFHVK